MILRPLSTTVNHYKPPQILLFFPIYIIKMKAILSWINNEFITVIIQLIYDNISPIELLVAQSNNDVPKLKSPWVDIEHYPYLR